MTTFEDIDCPVCGSAARKEWARENGFVAMRCLDCGLVYVSPRPDAAARAKALVSGCHDGEDHGESAGGYAPEVLLPRYRGIIIALYGRNALRGRADSWLDVGCGYGEWLEALREASGGSMRLAGVEPNRVKAGSARGRDIRILGEDIATVDESFDHVSLLNVYSHLPDPPAFFSAIAALLKPGGELLLQTGNGAEIEREEIPTMLGLPDHLTFASEAILGRLLRGAGFAGIDVLRRPMLTPPSGPVGWLKHGVKLCLRPEYRRLRWRNRWQDLWIRARRS